MRLEITNSRVLDGEQASGFDREIDALSNQAFYSELKYNCSMYQSVLKQHYQQQKEHIHHPQNNISNMLHACMGEYLEDVPACVLSFVRPFVRTHVCVDGWVAE